MFKIPSIGCEGPILSCLPNRQVCTALKSLAVPSPPAKVLYGGQAGTSAFFALFSPPIIVPYGNKSLNFKAKAFEIKIWKEWKEGVARLEFLPDLRSLKFSNGMINNTSADQWHRLKQKQLNQQFINEVIHGMQCSPFEAKALLDTVHHVYGSYFQCSPKLRPGQIQFVCVSEDNSPKLKLSECRMVTVTLTLDDGLKDLEIRQEKGIIPLRQHRLQRVCIEAFQQGGVLTVEDIACRLFNCGIRTINRDLEQFKKQGILLPMRSIIKDMGRSISHRRLIVKHWLMGKEYSQIARQTHHSIESVQNYVSKFKRVVSLSKDNFDAHTIAFLIKMSPQLVEQYFQLYQQQHIVEHRKEELENLIKKTTSNAILKQVKP